jgi:hypothetical protein
MAPPAEEEVVLDEVLLVGRDFANSKGPVGWSLWLGAQSRAVRRLEDDDAAPELVEGPALSAFSKSLASKLTCCGTRMPAWQFVAHAESITLKATTTSSGSNTRRMQTLSNAVIRTPSRNRTLLRGKPRS